MRPGLAPLRSAVIVLLALLLGSAGPAPAMAQDGAAPSTVVVTTDVLGSIVRELVGDKADVTVLIEGGVDPHAWAPSARDTETVFAADLVIANGLDLEEGLIEVLRSAEAEGVPVFHATDHVAVRALQAPAHGPADEEEAHEGHEHASSSSDPHFWLDPLAVREVVLALVPVLAGVGIDVGQRATDLAARLDALHLEVEATLASIPPERRRLVTGHESMSYFADRYGFQLIGAVVPGLSSQGEVSARELAELADAVREAGVGVVFAEVGTPHQIAEALASETGASVVEVALEQLPADGSYESLIRAVAATIAGALDG